MVDIIFLISLVVYGILTWVIVYHLHTYTINKKLAHHAIIVFVFTTIILVLAQFILFIVVRDNIYAMFNIGRERTETFKTF